MAGIQFGFGEVDEFNYEIGGIDWRDRYEQWKKKNGLTLPPVWVETEDGLVQQCTPDNLRVYINEVSDEHDCVDVRDPRDGLWWSMYREKFGYDEEGNSGFDDLITKIGHAALILHTTLPLSNIVVNYERENTRDIDDFDSVPDDWV